MPEFKSDPDPDVQKALRLTEDIDQKKKEGRRKWQTKIDQKKKEGHILEQKKEVLNEDYIIENKPTFLPPPFAESVFLLKAMATLVVSVSAISLRLLPFYERGFTWWAKGASLLFSDSFDVPRMRLQLALTLSFPNFEQPRLSIQMAVGALLAAIYMLVSAGEWLLWKFAQELRASEASPGLIEKGFMGLLSVSSWLIFRWPMELLQALLGNSKRSWKDTVDVTESCISCESSTLNAPAPVTHAAASCLIGSAALGGCIPVYLLTTTTSKAKRFDDDTGDVDVIDYTDKEDAMAVDKIFCVDNYLVAKLAFVVISSRCPWVVVVDFSGCPNLEGYYSFVCPLHKILFMYRIYALSRWQGIWW